MKIELLHIRDCPHVEQTKQLLADCLDEIGLGAIQIDDLEGEFSSPSIMVDGSDVMGEPAVAAACCRLDLPTRERVLAALRREGHGTAEEGAETRIWNPSLGSGSGPRSLIAVPHTHSAVG